MTSTEEPQSTTGTTTETPPKNLRSSVKKQADIIQATQASAQSKKKSKPGTTTEYVRITKAMLELTIVSLQAQKQLLEDLSNMTDDEKMETLFVLLDKGQDGSVDAVELAQGLRKIRGDVSFEESLAVAVDRVSQFDQEGRGKLNLADFREYVRNLCEALGTTYHDLSELLVMQALFSGDENKDLEDAASVLLSGPVTEAIQEQEAQERAMTDARMKALFNLFDSDRSGTVDFKEIVLGMHKITHDIEGSGKAALMALLLFDDSASRTLNYDQFAKFIVHVVAASPEGYTFDEIADAMTFAAAQDVKMSSVQIEALYQLHDNAQELLDLKENDDAQAWADVTPLQIRKSNALFVLWDTDEDGMISLKELILGLRKFEQTSAMNSTVEEAIGLMESYDIDSDHELNPREFCLFMGDFAKLSQTDLDATLDFMVVTSAMEKNTLAEINFLKAFDEGDVFHFQTK